MKTSTRLLISLFALFIIGALVYAFTEPLMQQLNRLRGSDAGGLSQIQVGCDNYFGYAALLGRTNRAAMRQRGYALECVDDGANYTARYQALSEGDLDLAVFTKGAYLQVGAPNWDAVEVLVMSESKGSDAIVANQSSGIGSLEDLKTAVQNGQSLRVAVTPDSPSWTLVNAADNAFGLAIPDAWYVQTNGSSDALSRLQRGQADIAVLWQPDITESLRSSNIVRLLGTEDTTNLIVDVLLASRTFAQRNPEAVQALTDAFFETLELYSTNTELLVEDIINFGEQFDTTISQDEARDMLAGIDYQVLEDNAIRWYGLADTQLGVRRFDAIETTHYLERTFLATNLLNTPVLPPEGAAGLTNSRFVEAAFNASPLSNQQFGQVTTSVAGLQRDFVPLSAEEWQLLRPVGSLKQRPIGFQASQAGLSDRGRQVLDEVASDLNTFSSFRLIIEGHTNAIGDAGANMQLSQARAQAIADYLVDAHGVDTDRLLVTGYGGSQPLTCPPEDSVRACASRQQRSVLRFVRADI
ncbi:MAG: phosphate ABC transporter substrate-binding/OmpA family protein [Deinococcota bacterium]